MARWKRTDIETKTKVIEAKLRNPEASLRDIQNETNVNHVTVSDILDEVPEVLTSSNAGEQIISTMDEIISEIADITRLAINPIRDSVIEWKLTVSDLKALNDIAKNNFDRRQLLTGKPTENVNILWDVLSELQWLKENS